MSNLKFVKFVTEFRGGALEAHLSKKLEQIGAGIAEFGGDGELTLKLKIKLTKFGTLDIAPKVDCKIPDKQIGPGVYWLDDNGEIVTRDPNQTDLEDIPGVSRMKN